MQLVVSVERSKETPLLALAGIELPHKGRKLVPMLCLCAAAASAALCLTPATAQEAAQQSQGTKHNKH
jgi:hypothetical protein